MRKIFLHITIVLLLCLVLMPAAVKAASAMKTEKKVTIQNTFNTATLGGNVYHGYVGSTFGGGYEYVYSTGLFINSAILNNLAVSVGGQVQQTLNQVSPAVGSEMSATQGFFLGNWYGFTYGNNPYSYAGSLASMAYYVAPGRCAGLSESGWGLQGSQTFVTGIGSSSKSNSASVVGKKILINEVTTYNFDQKQYNVYTGWGSKYCSPIILDMKGEGKIEASNGNYLPHESFDKNNLIVIDFFNNGFEIAMEWVGPNDGLLVMPKADGTVDAACLFGSNGGYEDGYEKLSTLDENNDKKLNGNELKALCIWQDKNQNAMVDDGEMISAKDAGITLINLRHRNFESTFVRNNKTYKMWDWWPSAIELMTVTKK